MRIIEKEQLEKNLTHRSMLCGFREKGGPRDRQGKEGDSHVLSSVLLSCKSSKKVRQGARELDVRTITVWTCHYYHYLRTSGHLLSMKYYFVSGITI